MRSTNSTDPIRSGLRCAATNVPKAPNFQPCSRGVAGPAHQRPGRGPDLVRRIRRTGDPRRDGDDEPDARSSAARSAARSARGCRTPRPRSSRDRRRRRDRVEIERPPDRHRRADHARGHRRADTPPQQTAPPVRRQPQADTQCDQGQHGQHPRERVQQLRAGLRLLELFGRPSARTSARAARS